MDTGTQHLPCGREARQAQHHEDPADAQEAQDEDLCAQVRQEKDRDQEEIEEVPRPGHPDKAPAPAPPGRNLTRGPEAQQVLDREERSEEHTSELQSLMRIPYAVFCLKPNK